MPKRKVYILLSKDAMCTDYLHFYGEKPSQFRTPNLDELVAKGTLFTKYYTAAASTVMSFYSFVTGVFSHETDFQLYERINLKVDSETFFTKLKDNGYENHLIWDTHWDFLPEYYDYYSGNIEIHSIEGIKESVGVHKKFEGELFSDDEKAMEALRKVETLIVELLNTDKNLFIWLHLPHVLAGRACYGADVDMFDKYVGMVRKYFPDDCIAVTADHGNMNGFHGKLAYGFDVYEKVARVPLITPRVEDYKTYDQLSSSVDLYSILFNKLIPDRKFVYCDTAYRAQESRRLAILYKNYKYIYNKRDCSEELYDLEYNPEESMNLISDKLYDVDRKITVEIKEQYFYPKWGDLSEVRKVFRTERKRIWRDGDLRVVIKSKLKDIIRPLYDKYLHITKQV